MRKFLAWLFDYENSKLERTVAGVKFRNPVGLAAGFDYDADLIEIVPSLGFGFHTIGTVTLGAYEGNPAPMLGRLPKSKSLLVNKGFKSAGMKAVLAKIGRRKSSIPLGISIGATNRPYQSFEEQIEEITKAFELAIAHKHFDYYELNVSCPNLINISQFAKRLDEPSGLKELLDRLGKVGIDKPVFVKMPSEKSEAQTLALCDVMIAYDYLKGVILSNLVKDRTNPAFDKDEVAKIGKGNFSGKPVEKLSNQLISSVHERFIGRLEVVGCGGIFTGEDAREKLLRGASLVQMITGMIYMGPSQIGTINKELARLI